MSDKCAIINKEKCGTTQYEGVHEKQSNIELVMNFKKSNISLLYFSWYGSSLHF